MLTITTSIVIAAPAERVFDQLTDPRNLLEIWPSLVDVARPRFEPDGRHAFDWTYRMAGIPFHGRCDTVEVERPRRRVDRNTGGIPSTFRWTIEARGEATGVELQVDYDVPGVLRILAGALLRALNEREAETLLANLKARIETGVPPVKRAA
jgi:carbon monoxide dehydrogenase subunit G